MGLPASGGQKLNAQEKKGLEERSRAFWSWILVIPRVRAVVVASVSPSAEQFGADVEVLSPVSEPGGIKPQ